MGNETKELEEYIAKLERRIEKIKNSPPDPNRLKSNQYRYEAQLEIAKERYKGYLEGRPFSDGGGGFMIKVLTESLGLLEQGAALATSQTKTPELYLNEAKKMGLPVEASCDMTMMPFAITELGMVPREDIAVCDLHTCAPMWLKGIYVATKSKESTFFFDFPLECDDRGAVHLAKQLQEFVDYCEHQYPGRVKLDEELFVRKLDAMAECERITKETYQLLKAHPCPISGMDAIGFQQTLGLSGAPEKQIQFCQARYEEIKERVEKGIGAIPEEKLRFVWTVSRPYFFNPFKVIEEMGAVVPIYYNGPSGFTAPLPSNPQVWNDHSVPPLQRLAKRLLINQWGHRGKKWVDDLIWVAKDLGADGIVNYNCLGCSATLSLKKLVADKAESELGIPTLQLEGKLYDKNYADEETITTKLRNFTQMCLDQKYA